MSSRDKYRERPRDRERERSRERSKHSSRDERDRHDSKRHEHKQKDRVVDRDKDRERDRARHKDKDRERRRRSRSPEKSRDRDRERHKSREHDGRRRDGSPAADDSSRKRRKVDDEKQQQQAQPQQQHRQQQHHAGQTEEEREAAHKKQRQDEQDALDAEMEERRKRVDEWRKKRAAEAAAAELERKQQEEAAAAAAAAEAAAGKGWSLEDDEDDDAHEQLGEDEVDPLDAFMAGNAAGTVQAAAPPQQQQQRSKPPLATAAADGEGDVQMADADGATAAAAAADEDEVDPLDAFMAENATAAAAAAAAAADDVDPLDAFMAAQVMPEVAKVGWSESVAEQGADAGAAGAAAAAAGGSTAAAGEGSRPGSRPGTPSSSKRAASSKPKSSRVRRYYGSSSSEEFSDSDDEGSGGEEVEEDDATWAKNVTAGKLSKGDKLMAADHSTIEYPHFRRNFYIEVPEIKRMSDADVAALRKELDGIKVRGKNPPRPIRAWTQSGISSKVLEMLRKQGFDRPLAIQAQALPIIMSGRDCIGIAKTGSGKTLAFVLPMLRHIKDQPPLANGDGPIALIMAPTRELVAQISKEVKRLGRAVMLSSVAVFGGSGVANQISELKRGTEVVVATPGRLIDLLVSGGGKITNLRRVTYLVMDEADRMFDMGFEPQIMRIVGNIRPDRQTVMFSATFPRSVETLARQVLQDPVEIQVGGRSVVNSDIAQFVEIRPEGDRFLRLLEVLGEWYEAGKIIIFVHTQDKCDNLFRDLLKAGYPCLSLHGGKEQSDRECTIADFKGAVCNILVATSVAARGLDVRDLVLVINYDVPNHHEDYVHRVGRTGRAGNKGTAITFIGPDEERYAPDLVKALKESSAPVPQDLQALAESFQAKRKAGLVQGHGSGYGGSGYKFDKSEDAKIKAARKSKAKEFGIVDDEEDGEAKAGEDSDDDIRPANQPSAAATAAAAAGAAAAVAAANAANANGIVAAAAAPTPTVTVVAGQQPVSGTAAAMLAAVAAAGAASSSAAAAAAGGSKFLPNLPGQQFPGQAVPQTPASLLEAAKAAAQQAAQQVMGGSAAAAAAPAAGGSAALAAMRAAALAAAFSQGGGAPAAAAQAAAAAQQQQQRNTGFEAEMEINDFPQNARWKVTHKGFQAEITELTGAAVTTKGIYVKSGEPPEGERKLFLLIEAPTEGQVRRAKQEIRRVIEEHVEKAMRRDTGAGGRYSIM